MPEPLHRVRLLNRMTSALHALRACVQALGGGGGGGCRAEAGKWQGIDNLPQACGAVLFAARQSGPEKAHERISTAGSIYLFGKLYSCYLHRV